MAQGLFFKHCNGDTQMSADALNNPVQFKLPPNKKFAASVFVNADYQQTVTIYQVPDEGQPNQIGQFQGSGQTQHPLGTQILESGGSGQIQVDIQANNKHSSVLGQITENPDYTYVLLYSEDGGGDADYNDSIVLINWPIT